METEHTCDNCGDILAVEKIHWEHSYLDTKVEEWYCSIPCFIVARGLKYK